MVEEPRPGLLPCTSAPSGHQQVFGSHSRASVCPLQTRPSCCLCPMSPGNVLRHILVWISPEVFWGLGSTVGAHVERGRWVDGAVCRFHSFPCTGISPKPGPPVAVKLGTTAPPGGPHEPAPRFPCAHAAMRGGGGCK